MIPLPYGYQAAIQIQRAFACPSLFDGVATYVIGQNFEPSEDRVLTYLHDVHPELSPTPVAFGWPSTAVAVFHRVLNKVLPLGKLNYTEDVNRVALLTAEQLAGLSRIVDQVTASHAGQAPGYDELMASFRRRFWRVD